MTKQELINALTELPGDAIILLDYGNTLWALTSVTQHGATQGNPAGHAILHMDESVTTPMPLVVRATDPE